MIEIKLLQHEYLQNISAVFDFFDINIFFLQKQK